MAQILYSDGLVTISDDTLFFRRYYFPFGWKSIDLSSIDYIEVLAPTLLGGKWQIHGTGDLRTWFPYDKNRPKRDCIFIMHRHEKRWRLEITVENSADVRKLFRLKHIPIKYQQPNKREQVDG